MTQTVATIAARLTTVISHFSTAQGSSDPVANPMAANGVYRYFTPGRYCQVYSLAGACRVIRPAWL